MEYQTNCFHCGKLYTAKRSTAKFCSAKCRQRDKRMHKDGVNIGVESSTATDAVRRLLQADDKHLYYSVVELERLFSSVEKLKNRIEDYATNNI